MMIPQLIRKIAFLTVMVTHFAFCSDNALDHALIGIYAVDCNTGQVVLSQNCDISMTPASCMKLVTTAASLHLLGPDSRFTTTLEYDGLIDRKKILQGNIYIHGDGDPCLGSDRIAGALSWKQQIDKWADAIEALGISTIKGKVIGDATKWSTALAVPSWSWEDLGNYYGAGASALSFHENQLSLFFQPADRIGAPALLTHTEPPIDFVVFQNEVTTGPEDSGDCACVFGSEFSPIQFIRGTVPLGVKEFSIKGSVPNPGAWCAHLLTLELQKRHIRVLAQEMKCADEKCRFHTTVSPTVGEIVQWTNQKSINLYAEHLLKKMGEVMHKEGSTDAGVKAVTAFWRAQKIDLNGFHMNDGSGLSQKNLITPKQLVAILLKMQQSPLLPLFYASLPEMEEGVRAKSGSLSSVKGLVGYSGNIAFAVLINHCTDKQAMQRKISSVLADIKRKRQ